jgi:hypothetical protein
MSDLSETKQRMRDAVNAQITDDGLRISLHRAINQWHGPEAGLVPEPNPRERAVALRALDAAIEFWCPQAVDFRAMQKVPFVPFVVRIDENNRSSSLDWFKITGNEALRQFAIATLRRYARERTNHEDGVLALGPAY